MGSCLGYFYKNNNNNNYDLDLEYNGEMLSTYRESRLDEKTNYNKINYYSKNEKLLNI